MSLVDANIYHICLNLNYGTSYCISCSLCCAIMLLCGEVVPYILSYELSIFPNFYTKNVAVILCAGQKKWTVMKSVNIIYVNCCSIMVLLLLNVDARFTDAWHGGIW